MTFHDNLKIKMHNFVKDVYRVTRSFPKEELYGITSQLRRAALSVILNYIEGFARRRGEKCKVYDNFLDISFGSLKESKYLIYFSYTENYINKDVYDDLFLQAEEISKMLWSIKRK
ncbi:four helix bundle protein [Candidatus Parcubacteria bacterium]|nr:four helix bundle protein [Candidatus Parcubacteria bacterium]